MVYVGFNVKPYSLRLRECRRNFARSIKRDIFI